MQSLIRSCILENYYRKNRHVCTFIRDGRVMTNTIFSLFFIIFISEDVLLRMFIMNLWLVSYKHKVEVYKKVTRGRCHKRDQRHLVILSFILRRKIGSFGVTNNGTAVETIIIVF